MNNREESIKALFRRYKDMNSSAADLQDWIMYTSDMPEADLQASVIELVKTFTYPDPKVADLRATWERILDARKDSGAAGKQWKNSVVKAMRREGRDWTPRFKDPITAEVIGTYSWKAMCNMDERDLEWRRRDFIKEYEAIADRQEAVSKLSPAARRLTHTERKQLT
jgi:hypothetical protein